MKKRIFFFIIIVIIAAFGGIGAYILTEANKGPAEIPEEEAKFKTTLKEAPTDGSLPDSYTSADNIAFALWKIENTAEFKTTTTGKSEASIATIQIYNQRTVKDGKAIVSTVSAGMVSSGKQKYFVDNKVLLRDASKINGFDTVWKTDQPECISNSAYINRYGWLPFSCTGYIICEETILEASALVNNGDGTYGIDLVLNPDSDYAPFWYRREVLTNAGSSKIPEFYSIKISYTFDSEWRILEARTQEQYKVKSMGVEAVSATDCTEVFSYENIEFNEDEYNFFKQYESLTPAEGEDIVQTEDDVLTMITSSLQNADGTDKNLKLTVSVGDKAVEGLASLNISDLQNVKVKALLDSLYIEYGDAIYIRLGGLRVKSTAATLTELISAITGAIAPDEANSSLSLDANQIIADLNNAEVKRSEDGTDIEVVANLNIMGLELPLYFHFTKTEDTYALLTASAELSVSGTAICISMAETAEEIGAVDTSDFQDIANIRFIVDAIADIIVNQRAEIGLEFTYDDLNIALTAKTDFADTVKLDCDINFGYKALNLKFNLKYINDTLYFSYGNIKVKMTLADLKVFLKTYAGIELEPNISLDLDIISVLDTLLSIDYDALLKDFSIMENNVSAVIGLDQFFAGMGDLQIAITEDMGLSVQALIKSFTVNATVASSFTGEITVSESEYQNLGYIDFIIDGVLSICEGKKVAVNLRGSYEGIELEVQAKIDFTEDLKLSANVRITKGAYTQEIGIIYLNETIYITLGGQKLKITVEDLKTLLGKCGVELNAETGININSIVDTLLSIDYEALIKEFRLAEGSLGLTVDLSCFIETMGEITAEITDTANGMAISLSMFDIKGSIERDETVEISVLESEYQNLGYIDFIIDGVLSICEGKKVAVNLSGSYEGIELEIQAKIDFTEDLRLSANVRITKDAYTQEIGIIYLNETIYITLGGQKLKITVEDLKTLLGKCGVELNAEVEININSIVDTLLSIDYEALIKEFRLAEGSLGLTVDLSCFIETMGEITAEITDTANGMAISLSMFDIKGSIERDETVEISVLESEYQNLGYIDFIIDGVLSICEGKKVAVNLSGDYEGIELEIQAKIDFTEDLRLSANVRITKDAYTQEIGIIYLNETIYITLGGQKLKITVEDLKTLLGKCGVELNAEVEININSIVDTLLSIDYEALIKEFRLAEGSLGLTVDLSCFIETMGEITAEITDTANGMAINLSMFDIKGSIEKDETVEISVLESEYQNLGYIDFIIDGVLSICEGKKVAVNLSGDYEGIELSGAAYVDFSADIRIFLDLTVAYPSEQISETFKLWIVNSYVYAEYRNIKLKLSLSQIEDLIKNMTDLTDGLPEINVNSIINLILSLDYEKLITNLTISSSEINIGLAVSELSSLSSFFENMKEISLVLKNSTDGFTVNANYFDLILSVITKPEFTIEIDGTEYLDAGFLLDGVSYLLSLLNKKSISLEMTGNIALALNEKQENIALEINLDLVLVNGKYSVDGTVVVRFMDTELTLALQAVDGCIYLTVFDQTLSVSMDSLEALTKGILAIVNEFTEEPISVEKMLDYTAISSVLDSIVLLENGLELNLEALIPQVAVLTVSFVLLEQTEGLQLFAGAEGNAFTADFSLIIRESAKTEVVLPAENIVSITKEDIEEIIAAIRNIIASVRESDGLTLDIQAELYGISVLGTVQITKDWEIYADLELQAYDDAQNAYGIKFGIYYIGKTIYISFNGLRLAFTTDDLTVIYQTVQELLDELLPAGEELSVNLTEILSSFKLNITEKEITSSALAVGIAVNLLSLENMGIQAVITKDSITVSAQITDNITVNSLVLSYGLKTVPTVNPKQYIAVADLISLFENLEQGVSSEGQLSINAMGYEIILPYEMQFKLDLIELLKGENVFKAIELELRITSEYYDPIVLTIVDGMIYLDSMETKYKYEIPVYSLKEVLGKISSAETAETESTPAEIFIEIVKYINGISFITSDTGLSVVLSEDLRNAVNTLLTDMLGVEIGITGMSLTLENLSASTADFDVYASVNVLGMEISAQLTTATVSSDYVTNMTEEEKNTYILTEDFTEHPFAQRVLDIIRIIKGLLSLEYSGTGQGFNLNIPLEVDSSLVDTCTVNGSMGVYFDLQGILDGNDIWSSFKLDASINIKAKMPWYLAGAKVNIDIQLFYIGDGFLYLIVDGNAAGIGFDITEMVIDLKGTLEDSMGGGSVNEPTTVYLNDLLNRIINGFTTQTVGNKTTLTLAPSAVEVVNTLWRSLVDTVNELVASLGNDTLTNLIESIVNFNMDVTGFSIEYIDNDGQFESLKITLSGYRHGTYTPTSLPITLTATGALADTHFDTYISTAAEEKYSLAREQISTAREMVNALGDFAYTEEYYEQAKAVQSYLDSMSDLAKASYETTVPSDGIAYYEALKAGEEKIREILDSYALTQMEGLSQETVLSCYEAYEFFKTSESIFSAEELDLYLEIYNTIASEALADFAARVNELEAQEIDFTEALEETLAYRDSINALYNEYGALSASYKSAFRQFYPEAYEKLTTLAGEYNLVASHLINEKIYEYIAAAEELESAQTLYTAYGFTEMQGYPLDNCDEDLAWTTLTQFIYNTYIRELDKEIGKAIEGGVVVDLMLQIPELQEQYQAYSTEFKTYFKNDITKLESMLEPAQVKYVEYTKELLDAFALEQEYVNYGAFNAQKSYYYDYAKLQFTDDNYESGVLLAKYFAYASESDISAWYDDSDAYTKFRVIAYAFRFILSVQDSSVSAEELQESFAALEDSSVNYYYTKYTTGIWGSKSWHNETHSYAEIFTGATEGYAYECYQAYLSRIQ